VFLHPAAAPTMPCFARAWKARSRKWTIASVHSGGALLFRGEMPTSGTMPEPHRFPPPWSVEDACFIVRDASGPRPGLRVWASGSHFAQYRTRQRWHARPRRSGTKRGLAAAYLIWIKKR
jgi:hypothetical protein